MHARVTTISGSPGEAEAGIDNFRANVVPFAQEQGKGAILLIDRQSGEAMPDEQGAMINGQRNAMSRKDERACSLSP